MEDRPISLRLPKSAYDEIARRVQPAGNDHDREYLRSDVIRAAIARYYECCRRHLAMLGLTREELALCCDALNGVWLTADADSGAAQLAVIWAGIADAIRLDGLAKKHGVDSEKLLARLQAATYADLVALVDFVERFWANDSVAAARLAAASD
jgi:Arc/MetJ-type ribon-helix-helix transcriptional regulator